MHPGCTRGIAHCAANDYGRFILGAEHYDCDLCNLIAQSKDCARDRKLVTRDLIGNKDCPVYSVVGRYALANRSFLADMLIM